MSIVVNKMNLTVSLVAMVSSFGAAASCYVVAPIVKCCSTVPVYDGVGDCPGESFDCPDIDIENPDINQVAKVALGTSGAKEDITTTVYDCVFQPRKCTPSGCVDFGWPEILSCDSEVPSGLNCPSGPPE